MYRCSLHGQCGVLGQIINLCPWEVERLELNVRHYSNEIRVSLSEDIYHVYVL